MRQTCFARCSPDFGGIAGDLRRSGRNGAPSHFRGGYVQGMRQGFWKTTLGSVGAVLGGFAAVANVDRTTSSNLIGDAMDVLLGGAIVGGFGLLLGAVIDRVRRRSNSYVSPINAPAALQGGGTSDELAKLGDLFQKGVLTEAEFTEMKGQLISGRRSGTALGPSDQPTADGSGVTPPDQARAWPRRVALVGGLLVVFSALIAGAGLLRSRSDEDKADSGSQSTPNDKPLSAYTVLATGGFTVNVTECDSSGARGSISNHGTNKAHVTVAATFYDANGIRLGGWNQQLDELGAGVTAPWNVIGGYPDVDRCEAFASSAFVAP